MAKVSVPEAENMMRLDISAMRKEYTRMRDIAQKRIKRMGESEFRSSKAYKGHPQGFAKLKDLDPRDLPKAFSELSKFVEAKGSTITGQRQIREKTIRTWQEQGLGLNRQNYDKTIKILEEMRKRKLVYGSDKAVALADTMMGLSPRQTNKWLEHLDVLLANTDTLQEIPNVRGYDFNTVLKMLGD